MEEPHWERTNPNATSDDAGDDGAVLPMDRRDHVRRIDGVRDAIKSAQDSLSDQVGRDDVPARLRPQLILVGGWLIKAMDAMDAATAVLEERGDGLQLCGGIGRRRPITGRETVMIYSREHNRWWKPNELGYTFNRNEAGRYTPERAAEICAHAGNLRDGGPAEFAIPVG